MEPMYKVDEEVWVGTEDGGVMQDRIARISMDGKGNVEYLYMGAMEFYPIYYVICSVVDSSANDKIVEYLKQRIKNNMPIVVDDAEIQKSVFGDLER